MTERRVVVTGVGATTALGSTIAENWNRLKNGVSGIGPITLFDASEFPTKIAGEVRNFNAQSLTDSDASLKEAKRGTLFGLHSAVEAYQDSRLKSFEINPERKGIYFGAGDNGVDFEPFVETLTAAYDEKAGKIDAGKYLMHSEKNMNAVSELEAQPFMTLTHLTRYLDVRGPSSSCLTACAASSQAIGEAYEWIKRGDVDVMIAGGSHSMIYPLGVAGFSVLNALSTRNDDPGRASRPFDKNRDGFVMAEGAASLILEDLEHAKRRNARIYGEIVGYGATADAYRLTDMDSGGKSARRAIEIAMEKGNLDIKDVDYINAHGTSTTVNDYAETQVIKTVFGKQAYNIPVSSIKSMLGHMIAAAGAMEAIVCLLSIKDSVIPPTINYDEPDPDCDLDYVPNKARRKNVRVALSNSFGFGGQNICLAFKKYSDK